MNNTELLTVAMAEQCRNLLAAANVKNLDLPDTLKPRHLLWMCDCVEQYADQWPETKLHRWIGFIQAAIMANQLVDLPGLKQMFHDSKIAHAEPFGDSDLLDHLDLEHDFLVDIGGEKVDRE